MKDTRGDSMLERLPALVLSERVDAKVREGRSFVPVQGVPILPMPPHVLDAARWTAEHPGPRISRGMPELRQVIAEKLTEDIGITVRPDSGLLITHGAQHGMSIALRALIAPGDEVLVPAPTYFFDGLVRLAGGTPRYIHTTARDGWRIDVNAIAAAISARTRAILLCNPNNPTGDVPTRECLRDIVTLAESHGLIVFSDESYERYVHDGPGYVPLMSFSGISDRLVTVTSLSKNYAFTNWRVGYVHSSKRLIAKIHTALECDVINVGDVPQAAAVAALTGPSDWLDGEFATMRERRDILMTCLAEASVPAVRPAAGVFVFADLAVTGRHGSDLEELLLDAGIPALSGQGFKGPADHVRLLYGAARPDVEELGRRIGSVVSNPLTRV
jgi:aminotransferase